MTPKRAVSPMETFRRMRRNVEKNSANDLILGVGDACHRPNPTHQLQDSLVSSKQIEDGHHDCPLRAFTTSRSVLFVARVIAVSPLGVGCLHICPRLHEHLDNLRFGFYQGTGHTSIRRHSWQHAAGRHLPIQSWIRLIISHRCHSGLHPRWTHFIGENRVTAI